MRAGRAQKFNGAWGGHVQWDRMTNYSLLSAAVAYRAVVQRVGGGSTRE